MNNSFKVIFILIIITSCYTWSLLSSIMKRIDTIQTNYIDLPEEISEANNGDTLYCIKRNDTLFIQFK